MFCLKRSTISRGSGAKQFVPVGLINMHRLDRLDRLDRLCGLGPEKGFQGPSFFLSKALVVILAGPTSISSCCIHLCRAEISIDPRTGELSSILRRKSSSICSHFWEYSFHFTFWFLHLYALLQCKVLSWFSRTWHSLMTMGWMGRHVDVVAAVHPIILFAFAPDVSNDSKWSSALFLFFNWFPIQVPLINFEQNGTTGRKETKLVNYIISQRTDAVNSRIQGFNYFQMPQTCAAPVPV